MYLLKFIRLHIFTKVLEITWAKPMYMKYIFLCEGGMHLLITGFVPGRVAQLVTCLATDACLTADPGVASSIPARYHTFVEIDHEIISTVILLLPLIYSRRVVVSYKRKYVHKLLVNRLLKPAQEKVWLSELTVLQ